MTTPPLPVGAVRLWRRVQRFTNRVAWHAEGLKHPMVASDEAEYVAVPVETFAAMSAGREAVVDNDLWRLFLVGCSVGGDPGWRGGPNLEDIEADPGQSSAEQIDIRKAQRHAFQVAVKRIPSGGVNMLLRSALERVVEQTRDGTEENMRGDIASIPYDAKDLKMQDNMLLAGMVARANQADSRAMMLHEVARAALNAAKGIA